MNRQLALNATLRARSTRPRFEYRAGRQAPAGDARLREADLSGPAVMPMGRRVAFDTWMDAHRHARVRLITGPAGSGKTSALRAWAHEGVAGRVMWISPVSGCSPESLFTEFIAGLFLQPASTGADVRLDVIVDGLDDLPPETHDVLRRLVFRVPANVHLIYVARSPSAIDLSDGKRHGLVVPAPPGLLSIAPAELALWCERAGITATATECTALVDAAQGNTAAIAAVLRVAVEHILPLGEAALRRSPAPAYEPPPVPSRLSSVGRSRIRGRSTIEPAVIEMFGRFRMRFGDREVNFVRRRDRQIVQFLALRSGGTASRADIMAEFWPDTDRRDAARRLRTACSTIRRAISACVGDDALDAYFRTEGTAVVLCPENVINEADAFEEHIAYAQHAGERGDFTVARRHVSAALRLHNRPLLSGEPPAPWIADRARICEELADRARDFLFGNVEGTRIA